MFGGGGGATCAYGEPDDDADQDGFTIAGGDCADCDPARNPNAIEVVADPSVPASDENCDGQVDEPFETCDAGLALTEADPVRAARALEICRTTEGTGGWGLVSATWVLPDGALPPAEPDKLAAYHHGHGIFDSFGQIIEPRTGESMLALSSGAARRPSDPDFVHEQQYNKYYSSGHPAGFPKEAPACPGILTGEHRREDGGPFASI